MNKKIVVGIVGCFTFSVGVIATLFLLSGELRDRHNSFLRQFPPHPVMEGDTLNIRYNNYYIAGGTEHFVYLANYSVPLHLLEVNLKTLDTQFVSLRIKNIKNQKLWAPRVAVDSPYYYLSDGSIPVIFKGSVTTGIGKRFTHDSAFFSFIVPLDSQSFATKTLSSKTKENILGKITAYPPYERYDDRLLKKQIDGIFCTDGTMNYDQKTNRLVYVYHYRNQYTVMDSSLKLLYRANTIDTNSVAKIGTASLNSGATRVLSTPPYIVNKKISVSGIWLFINSLLLAKNEPAAASSLGAEIDVYDLRNGKYRFSFYLYNLNGQQMTDFKIVGSTMVVLYKKTLQVYRLRPKIFREDILVQ